LFVLSFFFFFSLRFALVPFFLEFFGRGFGAPRVRVLCSLGSGVIIFS
jgi:hypothetical protein